MALKVQNLIKSKRRDQLMRIDQIISNPWTAPLACLCLIYLGITQSNWIFTLAGMGMGILLLEAKIGISKFIPKGAP